MRRVSGTTGVVALLNVLVLLLSACNSATVGTNAGTGASTTAVNGSVTVALVADVGELKYGSFNQLAYEGYTRAQKQYGFKSTVIQAQTASANEYIQNLRTAANEANLVIVVGSLMQNPLDIVAKQNPKTDFAMVDGCAIPDPNNPICENLPNVAILSFKEREAGCLVGAMAAQMEVDGKARVPKLLGKNTMGVVGGLPIPPYTDYIAGYKYCAKKVDPSINFILTYSNDFVNPTTCQTDAESLIANNQADIIFQVAGACGIGVLDAATQLGVYSIGTDWDQSRNASGRARPSVITSALKRVDTAVYGIIRNAEANRYAAFVANPQPFDLAHDGVGFAAPSADVPEDAIQMAMRYEDEIRSGRITPPRVIPS